MKSVKCGNQKPAVGWISRTALTVSDAAKERKWTRQFETKKDKNVSKLPANAVAEHSLIARTYSLATSFPLIRLSELGTIEGTAVPASAP